MSDDKYTFLLNILHTYSKSCMCMHFVFAQVFTKIILFIKYNWITNRKQPNIIPYLAYVLLCKHDKKIYFCQDNIPLSRQGVPLPRLIVFFTQKKNSIHATVNFVKRMSWVILLKSFEIISWLMLEFSTMKHFTYKQLNMSNICLFQAGIYSIWSSLRSAYYCMGTSWFG